MGTQYAPQTPPGFPLDAEKQAFLVRVLDYWEQSSAKVKRSSANFRSWDYDPEFCNYRDPQKNNSLAAHRIQDGQIRFSSPDKGQYEVTKVWVFAKTKNEEGVEQVTYRPIESDNVHEKWICDGKGVYEFDYENKKLYETPIPKEMQGQNIANSPLPFFLFGAKKDEMLSRYWLRTVTPKSAEKDKEIWLEAYPKTVGDRRNYKKLEIILSVDDFLPRSLHIYAPNYDAAKNPQSRAFQFVDKKANDQLEGIRDFFGFFVRPMKPYGWDWVKRQIPNTGKPATANLTKPNAAPVRDPKIRIP